LEGRLKIVLESSNYRLLEAIYNALYPETIQPPSTECRISQEIIHGKLLILIECDRINLLRAVTNSYLGVISSLLESLEGMNVE